MTNLDLWKTVEKTPHEHTKAITGKSYKGTSPKPHYMVWKATETFGPCGIGWGFNVISERVEEGEDGKKVHIAHVKVWYKWNDEKGEVEHIGGTEFSGKRKDDKPFTDEDAPKKSVTDALIKALSMIGFAGDIFMGRYDDSKYVSELKQEESQQKKKEPQRKNMAVKADSPQEYAQKVCTMISKANADELQWINQDNAGPLDNLQSQFPDLWAKIEQAVIDRKAALKG